MPLKSLLVSQSLLAKGFKQDRARDHVYFFFYYNGRRTAVRTKISHNEREINDNLCAFMARQMGLTVRQFREFVDCSLTGKMYAELLIRSGRVQQ